MNRLWLQLTLGFALVTLVSTLTVALLANGQADTTFRGYLVQSQVLESGVVERLATLYADQGSWAGAEALLTMPRGAGGMGMGHGQGMGMGALRSSLALADADGRIVADPTGLVAHPTLSASEQAEALPILVAGRTVGYLLVRSTGGTTLPVAAQHYLDTVNRTLSTAGLLAGVLS